MSAKKSGNCDIKFGGDLVERNLVQKAQCNLDIGIERKRKFESALSVLSEVKKARAITFL